ncbi:Spo0E family sporulation regulatory protein-aspartic acid phosphatase [Clostridium sp.]|uniref:Spo0E family sporulation regulatory protein-aspartic acid phosphatase n=1 Tax=Clostridium sp. TaxID=1506 RepID=UPI00260384C3|nr:Spo0E family sporulation regulatory protein-aspartic acid phosphatase [Clostridium sp.]
MNLEETEQAIYRMREALHKIIDNGEKLIDIQVIIASENLNHVLNEYYKLLKKKIK